MLSHVLEFQKESEFFLVALTIELPTMTISDDERTFIAGLGERVARLRKARGITPVQLAEALGVSQQTVQACEVGRRRIPVSTLRSLAKTPSVSFDELMAEGEHAPHQHGPVPQVQRQLERISAAQAQAAGGDGRDGGLAGAAGPLTQQPGREAR